MKIRQIISGSGAVCALLGTFTMNSQAAEQVLTLEEAAGLLRVTPQEVAQMAERNELPGRRIGSDWRFHRRAVMSWLAGEDPVAAALLAEEAKDQPVPWTARNGADQEVSMLSSVDLEAIKGRGPASESAPAAKKEPETMGQRPDQSTAEQVFLRDQGVLLKPGQVTLELGLQYQRLDQRLDFTVSDPDDGTLRAWNTTHEVDAYAASFTARYGLWKDLQAFAAIPLQHVSTTSRNSITGTRRILGEGDDSTTAWGDIVTGLRWGALREGVGHPSVILSVNGSFPTENGPYGIGGGIALTKSYDPAILFANLEYRHNFINDEAYVLDFGYAEDRFTGTFGIAYALNETLTLSTRFIGDFTSRTMVDSHVGLPSTQRYSLQLGMTSLITDDLYIEPSVRFGLNGDNRNTVVGINIPYTFDL